jgi:thymidylate kinase
MQSPDKPCDVSAIQNTSERKPAEFWVLLGADYAGKSSVLAQLSSHSKAYCISYDDGMSGSESALIGCLREAFRNEVISQISSVYSPELLISLFHVYMVYLRDKIRTFGCHKPIIVDSYYYKILAKFLLVGLTNDNIFQLWRSLPKPKQIIYLDVDTETAWQRSRAGQSLNRMEYYGSKPTRIGFQRFQTDLRDVMLREVAGIKLEKLRISGKTDALSAVEHIIFSASEP